MSSNLIPRRKGENDAEFTKRVHSQMAEKKARKTEGYRDLRKYIKSDYEKGGSKGKKSKRTKGLEFSYSGIRRLTA